MVRVFKTPADVRSFLDRGATGLRIVKRSDVPTGDWPRCVSCGHEIFDEADCVQLVSGSLLCIECDDDGGHAA